MGLSGSCYTTYHVNQRQEFHWTATPNITNRTYTISWRVTTNCNDNHASPTYYLWNEPASVTVNGKEIVKEISYYANGHTVYRGFADNNSKLDLNYNGRVYHDLNGDYVGINRYVEVLGTNWLMGSFNIKASDDGSAQFSVFGKFMWRREQRTFSQTFNVSDSSMAKKVNFKFSANSADLYTKEFASISTPTEPTLYVGDTLIIPTSVPYTCNEDMSINHDTYKFLYWTTTPQGSFFGRTKYYPGDRLPITGDLTLYAVWEPVDISVSFYLLEGFFKLDESLFLTDSNTYIKFPYGSSVDDAVLSESINKVPIQYNSTAYGKVTQYPVSWYTSEHMIQVSGKYGSPILLPDNQFVSCRGKILISYSTDDEQVQLLGNNNYYILHKSEYLYANYFDKNYSITLKTTDDKLVRTIPQTFSMPVVGDFSYNPNNGFECIGWTTTKGGLFLQYDETVEPAINSIDVSTTDRLYIGSGEYSTIDPFVYGNGEVRTYFSDENIVLYPIQRAISSCYVYTGESFILATPYVWTGSEFNMAISHVWNNGKFNI